MDKKEADLRHAIVMGRKFMGTLNELSELTGKDPGEVLRRALALYKTVKKKEREGYWPAMVKDKKATRIEES